MNNTSIESEQNLIKNIVDKACYIFKINYMDIAIMIRISKKKFFEAINSQDPDLLTYTFKKSIYNFISRIFDDKVEKDASLITTPEFVKLQGLLKQLKTNTKNSAASKRVATKRKNPPPTSSTSKIIKSVTTDLSNLGKRNKELSFSSPKRFKPLPIVNKRAKTTPFLNPGGIVVPNQLTLHGSNNEKTIPVFKSTSISSPMSISFLIDQKPEQEQQKNISDLDEAEENSAKNNYPTT